MTGNSTASQPSLDSGIAESESQNLSQSIIPNCEGNVVPETDEEEDDEKKEEDVDDDDDDDGDDDGGEGEKLNKDDKQNRDDKEKDGDENEEDVEEAEGRPTSAQPGPSSAQNDNPDPLAVNGDSVDPFLDVPNDDQEEDAGPNQQVKIILKIPIKIRIYVYLITLITSAFL